MATGKHEEILPEVAEAAAGWIARLDNRHCSAGEREAFERWRRADPAHAAAYHQAEAMWQDSGALIRSSMALSRVARNAMKAPPEPRRFARAWWPAAALAASLAIAVAVPYLAWWPAPPPQVSYATGVGEQRSLALADGSGVVLDTRTVLVERYGTRERRIDLPQGQAQFEVRRDPSRPFVVHAAGGQITAIGTRFQVRVADDGARVTLLEGKVRVATRPAHGVERVVTLYPGQVVRLGTDGTLGAVQAADMRLARGWTEGKLYVDGWRMQDFVTELNRYGSNPLRIDDPGLGDVRISGVFQTRNRDNLVRLLAQGWGIQSQRTESGEILLSRP